MVELLTKEQGKNLLLTARRAITEKIRNNKQIPFLYGGVYDEKRGLFCTLKTDLDVLRGCIGFPLPHLPLGEAIVEAAVASATQDNRFKPVTEEELDHIKIDISVLTVPQEIETKYLPQAIEIGKHGLIIEHSSSSGLLLPVVAVESHMSKIEFLESVCWKAGLPPHAWKESKIFLFEAQVFQE